MKITLNDSILEGEIEKDSINGRGRLIDGDGNIFKGIFKNNDLRKGTIIQKRARKMLKGNFLNNKPHGK